MKIREKKKARRSELAKKHGIDMTKPGARAKLTRLMKADTISKKTLIREKGKW